MSISFKGKRSEINELKKELASVKLSERVEAILAEQVSLPYSEDQAAALAALQRRADAASDRKSVV